MKKFLLIIVSLMLLGHAQESSDLELAYQKEFTFLKAQKRSLEERLGTMKAHNKEALQKAQSNLDTLQAKLIRLDTAVDQKAQSLAKAERDEQDVSDNSQIVDSTLMQVKTTLEPLGFVIDPKASKAQTMRDAFAFASQKLSTLGSVTKTQGSFFLADGTRVEGTIIKVGNIASYGVAGDNAVALVPAGEGQFKAWGMPAANSARALDKGETVDTLAMFLYENSDKEIEAPKEKTLMVILKSGGAVGWVIVSLGVIAMLLIFARIFFLKQADSNTAKIRAEVVQALLEEGQEQALKVCKKNKGAISRVLATTIRNIDREREHLEDLVAESVMHENNYLDRFGQAIMVIAAVAPLLGLLGTVTGMISTFDVITEFGTGDPKMLSGGISEALVTTELGLIVAIPGLLMGNLLSGWAERIKDGMEQAALNITNVYLNKKKA